jgi:hypothetical protein
VKERGWFEAAALVEALLAGGRTVSLDCFEKRRPAGFETEEMVRWPSARGTKLSARAPEGTISVTRLRSTVSQATGQLCRRKDQEETVEEEGEMKTHVVLADHPARCEFLSSRSPQPNAVPSYSLPTCRTSTSSLPLLLSKAAPSSLAVSSRRFQRWTRRK